MKLTHLLLTHLQTSEEGEVEAAGPVELSTEQVQWTPIRSEIRRKAWFSWIHNTWSSQVPSRCCQWHLPSHLTLIYSLRSIHPIIYLHSLQILFLITKTVYPTLIIIQMITSPSPYCIYSPYCIFTASDTLPSKHGYCFIALLTTSHLSSVCAALRCLVLSLPPGTRCIHKNSSRFSRAHLPACFSSCITIHHGRGTGAGRQEERHGR